MIKHYEVKDFPKIKEIISIQDLDKLKIENSFLVIIVNTLNPDEVADLVDDIGVYQLGIPVVISTNEMSVYEVCDKLVKEANEKKE